MAGEVDGSGLHGGRCRYITSVIDSGNPLIGCDVFPSNVRLISIGMCRLLR